MSFFSGNTITEKRIITDIANTICDEFLSIYDIDLSKDLLAYKRIQQESSRVYHEFSVISEHHVYLPYIHTDNMGFKNIDLYINRDTKESLLKKYYVEFDKILSSLRNTAIDPISRSFIRSAACKTVSEASTLSIP
jgi:molecular chaperone DnaK (HSP70)